MINDDIAWKDLGPHFSSTLNPQPGNQRRTHMVLTSEQRAEISRNNGRQSRGPKTDSGKRAASLNETNRKASAVNRRAKRSQDN
jgi:hypothetical protein